MDRRDLDPDEIPIHDERAYDELDLDPPEVARSDVIIRALYSALFGVIISVIHSAIFALVVFQLVYSLVTQKVPGPRVQHFGNMICAYYQQMLRYLTHNDSLVPFPFSDFPNPTEPGRPAYVSYEDREGSAAEGVV
jgi:hypothetical protein